MGTPVVEMADTVVLFLACCVPDLKLDGGYLQVERLCEKGAYRKIQVSCSVAAKEESSDLLL